MEIVKLILYGSVFIVICDGQYSASKIFKKSMLLGRVNACAIDANEAKMVQSMNLIGCAISCIGDSLCVNFNYWTMNCTCQLFHEMPYKLVAQDSCLNYDGFPRARRLLNATDNLARYQRTSQSSVYNYRDSWVAVDNGYDTLFCAHTNEDDASNNWYMVDMGDLVCVSHVRILARYTVIPGNGKLSFYSVNAKITSDENDVLYGITVLRYKNLTIGVTNASWLERIPIRNTYPLCGVYLGPGPNAEWFQVKCSPTIPVAQFLIIHQTRVYSAYGGYLCLCEVEIYGRF